MQVGAVYPQIELRGDPSAVRRLGLAVEALGFDYLLAYDHVLGAVHADRTPQLTGPYAEHDPFHDPFVMFAYLAAITERIQFATGVLILPQRQTVLVARQEEQIGLLRRLFTEPVVDFSGRFDRVDRAALVPRPAHPIPIWLGGFSEAAYDRAARLADGFIFIGGDINHVIDAWRSIRDRVRSLGRSVEDFGAEYVVRTQGTPGDLTAEVDAWRQAGGTHLAVVTMGLGLDSIGGHIDYLASVANALSLSWRLPA